jgi:H+/Cl- antiporter ClcA
LIDVCLFIYFNIVEWVHMSLLPKFNTYWFKAFALIVINFEISLLILEFWFQRRRKRIAYPHNKSHSIASLVDLKWNRFCSLFFCCFSTTLIWVYKLFHRITQRVKPFQIWRFQLQILITTKKLSFMSLDQILNDFVNSRLNLSTSALNS